MSKKRNIAYVKPEDPSFLRKLKEQAGYKEGPTVETKRENLGPVADEDLQDTEEEQPQIVVLRPGDLSAAEASREILRLEKEEEEKPADLNAPIVFRKPAKKPETPNSGESSEDKDKKSGIKRSPDPKEKNKKSSKKLKNKSLLSFSEDQEEDEDH